MGQEQSDMNGEQAYDEHDEEEPVDVDVLTLFGYRAMKVFRGSPAARSGLAAFEDFIVAVNGSILEGDGALSAILAESDGVELQLGVWNCVDNAERTVSLTPSKWNGPGLLGAAVRFEAIKGAVDFVWRVLDVMPNSPADDAGLGPRSDYIVGTTVQVFRSENALATLVCYRSLNPFPISTNSLRDGC
jgi:hypothetical protein